MSVTCYKSVVLCGTSENHELNGVNRVNVYICVITRFFDFIENTYLLQECIKMEYYQQIEGKNKPSFTVSINLRRNRTKFYTQSLNMITVPLINFRLQIFVICDVHQK